MSSPSTGPWSIWVSYGGQWKLKMARSGSRTCRGHRLEPGPELVLRHVARAMPRGHVRVAAARELDPVGQLQDSPLEELDPGRRLDHRVDLRRVVVARVDVAGHGRVPVQALVGQAHPLLDAPDDLLGEQSAEAGAVAAERLGLVGIAAVGVVARVGHTRLERARSPPPFSSTCCLPRKATCTSDGRDLDEGHDRLARDVAAEHERVGGVELSGVEELLEAPGRPVDVAGVEDLHGQSGGISL